MHRILSRLGVVQKVNANIAQVLISIPKWKVGLAQADTFLLQWCRSGHHCCALLSKPGTNGRLRGSWHYGLRLTHNLVQGILRHAHAAAVQGVVCVGQVPSPEQQRIVSTLATYQDTRWHVKLGHTQPAHSPTQVSVRARL